MIFRFGTRSELNLEGVHTDLVAVCRRALELTQIDFMIVDGLRTEKEQIAYVASGASMTKRSRHLTGHAIDFAAFQGGKISWQAELYPPIVEAFKTASLVLKTPIICGIDWKSFPDLGHIELDRRKYP